MSQKHSKRQRVENEEYFKREFDKLGKDKFKSLLQSSQEEIKALFPGTTATDDTIMNAWNEAVIDSIVAVFKEKRQTDDAFFQRCLSAKNDLDMVELTEEHVDFKAYRSTKTLKAWIKFINEGSLSIEETLNRLSKTTEDQDEEEDGRGIRTINAVCNDKHVRAYYISGSGAVDFRHEGVIGRKPKQIYLEDFSNPTISELVHVFYSSSGSGKTVDLAGSAVTRKCHLAIVVTPTDEYYVEYSRKLEEEAEVSSGDDPKLRRQNRSLWDFEDKIERVLDSNQKEFKQLLNAATDDHKLKLVVAIDEASQCPNLVRSIIHNPAEFKNRVVSILKYDAKDDAKNVEVLFSVAGTGASASTVGSKPENFKNLRPSFVQRHVELTKKLLRNYSLPKMLVPGKGGDEQDLSECIGEYLPVVSVMMENGRMASIACSVLQEQDKLVPLLEATLVERIAFRFMRSNGLQKLMKDPDHRHLVAAAALAVHLFQARTQDSFPADDAKYEEMARKMDFALPLAADMKDNDVSVKRIVSKYGLLEPNYEEDQQKWGANMKITKPFFMTASQ